MSGALAKKNNGVAKSNRFGSLKDRELLLSDIDSILEPIISDIIGALPLPFIPITGTVGTPISGDLEFSSFSITPTGDLINSTSDIVLNIPNKQLKDNWTATSLITGTCLTIIGYDATSSNFALKVKSVALSDLFQVRNDGATLFFGLIKNGVGTTIADINGGFNLNDNAGNPVIYLGAKQLYAGGTERLDWANRYCKNSSNFQTINWENCLNKDSTNVDSYSWTLRRFYASTGALVADYSNPVTISVPNIQVGNAGLATGQTYFDTPANIALNGDLTMARKV